MSAAASHPDYMGVWCPTCREDCIPIHGRCGFCETRVEDVDGNPITEKETPVANACKVDGCTNPSAGKGGSWHGMCDEHISIEARRRQAVRFATKAAKPPGANRQPTKTVAPPVAAKQPAQAAATVGANGHAPVTLTELAQAVDQAHAIYIAALDLLKEAVTAA